MQQDLIDYLELDHKSDEELFNIQKEHKLRELGNIRKVINENLHNYDLTTIEEYKDYLLQKLDSEINEMDFYSNHITNTYEETEFREFLIDYKSRLEGLFNDYLCVHLV